MNEKKSTKSSSEKIDRKMNPLEAHRKDQPTDMNNQYKQPWRKQIS